MIHTGMIAAAQQSIGKLADDQAAILIDLARAMATYSRKGWTTESDDYKAAAVSGEIASRANRLAFGLLNGRLDEAIDIELQDRADSVAHGRERFAAEIDAARALVGGIITVDD